MKTIYGYNFWPRGDEAGTGGFQWRWDEAERNRDYDAHRIGLEAVNAPVDLWHWHKWEYETDLTDTDAITKLIDHQLDTFEISEKEDKREVER